MRFIARELRRAGAPAESIRADQAHRRSVHGGEVGNLACTLPDMIYIVRGDLPVSRAIADERLEVIGKAKHRKALSRWLNLSPLTAVESRRHELKASV